jgi:uncharacterized protein YndB with AHSA1/START domain
MAKTSRRSYKNTQLEGEVSREMKRPITASVVIRRPIGEVFQFVVNTDFAPRWQAELVAVKDLSAIPIREDTIITTVLRFLGRRVENRMRVVVYEPPHKFALDESKEDTR